MHHFVIYLLLRWVGVGPSAKFPAAGQIHICSAITYSIYSLLTSISLGSLRHPQPDAPPHLATSSKLVFILLVSANCGASVARK
jgi:hypothetical protein